MNLFDAVYEVKKPFVGRTHPYKNITIIPGQTIQHNALTRLGYDSHIIQSFCNKEQIDGPYLILSNKNENTITPNTLHLSNPPEEKEEEKINLPWEEFSPFSCAQNFIQHQPLYYDKAKIWWMWNKKETCWQIIDEIDIVNSYKKYTGQTKIINQKFRSEVLLSLQMLSRDNAPKQAKEKYIQFKDKVFDIETKNIHQVESRFFFTNPIPWDIGKTSDTPTLDRLFREWVGEKYVKTLYEIVAYCCYREQPIQVFFCFLGHGRNGKSQFQRILTKFLGGGNVCSVQLEDITGHNKNRFATFKMYTKLVCQMGETNFEMLNDTNLLKLLTGDDPITYEKKGKDPFDDYSYTKILINSNSVPSSSDTSDGWYRRWIIIDFPNEFPIGQPVFKSVPDSEYENLARKCIELLPEIVERGEISNQGNVEDRKRRYLEASNPLAVFIDTFCDKDSGTHVNYNDLFNGYIKYLLKNKRRVVSRKEFKQALQHEGLEYRRTSYDGDSGWFVDGVTLKQNWLSILDVESNVKNVKNGVIPTQLPPHIESTSFNNIFNIFYINKIKPILETLNEVSFTELEEVFTNNGFNAETELDRLKKEGTIYEPKPNVFKLLP